MTGQLDTGFTAKKFWPRCARAKAEGTPCPDGSAQTTTPAPVPTPVVVNVTNFMPATAEANSHIDVTLHIPGNDIHYSVPLAEGETSTDAAIKIDSQSAPYIPNPILELDRIAAILTFTGPDDVTLVYDV